MSTLFASLLITHIVAGLLGTMALFATLLVVLKKEVSSRSFTRLAGLSWISFIISWFSGGYYYWFYYGDKVKPVIKAGEYVWAHNVVMEAKEHVFLMLPVLSLVITLIAWSSTECINTDQKLKSAVSYLVAVTFIIAVLVTLSGILISGGAQ